ncbi:hypothetical protein F5051DRAFT_397741 [Lentinula edodes]|nr:hypothetical protein F5051DRAFT_397741 [Lentinula edodes]
MRLSFLLIPTFPVLMAFLTNSSPVTAGSGLTRRAADFKVEVAHGDCLGPSVGFLTPGNPTLDIASVPGFPRPTEVENSEYSDEFCIIFYKFLPDVCRLVVYTVPDGDIGSPRGRIVSGKAGEELLESHLRKLEVHCDEKKTGKKWVSGGSAQQKGSENPNP